jgi:hypothetical protein
MVIRECTDCQYQVANPNSELQAGRELLRISILVRVAAVMFGAAGLLFRTAAPGGMLFIAHASTSAAAERSGLARPFA